MKPLLALLYTLILFSAMRTNLRAKIAINESKYQEGNVYDHRLILKEIKPPWTGEYTPTGMNCPNCRQPLKSGPVSCPDGKRGCLVLHNGYVCSNCGKQFQ